MDIFRKDLKLSTRWWHRLFVVIFIISFVCALYSVWNTPLPKYGVVTDLNSRMSTKLQLLPELIASDEKIGRYENNLHGELYEKNEGWALRQPDVYCARNITQHIEEISKKTGVIQYKGNEAAEILSAQDFKRYISGEGANCVYATSLADNTRVIGWAWFVGNDLNVWKESTFASALYILKGSLMMTIPFVLVVVLYYTVFLYIIFGRRKTTT